MGDAMRRSAQAVNVPVTADIEAGFSATAQDLERNIEQIVKAGAVGMNLEDALPNQGEQEPLYPIAEQVERIQRVRKLAERMKIHLVINARTDAYWQDGVSPEAAMSTTLERGRAYLQAGAACIFVPGLTRPELIRSVVEQLKAPVNVLGLAGMPRHPELGKLGVKRSEERRVGKECRSRWA